MAGGGGWGPGRGGGGGGPARREGASLPGGTVRPSHRGNQSSHPKPGPGLEPPKTPLRAWRAPGPPPALAPQTYTRSAAGRGAAASGTGLSAGGGPASGGRLGSRRASGGERAPRPRARPAAAPRHPPAALAPARGSGTDMKRGPRTPKKPAPANQRRAPPSLRPPLAAPATPGPPDSRADPPRLPPSARGPPPRALPAAPAARAPRPDPHPPAGRCAPSCGRSGTRLPQGRLPRNHPPPTGHPLPGSPRPAPSGRLGVRSQDPRPSALPDPTSFTTERGRPGVPAPDPDGSLPPTRAAAEQGGGTASGRQGGGQRPPGSAGRGAPDRRPLRTVLDGVGVAGPAAPERGRGRPLPGRGLRRPTGRTAWGEAAETRAGAGAGSQETPPGRRRHFSLPGVPEAAPGERQATDGDLCPRSHLELLSAPPAQRPRSEGGVAPCTAPLAVSHCSDGETEAPRGPTVDEGGGGRKQRTSGCRDRPAPGRARAAGTAPGLLRPAVRGSVRGPGAGRDAGPEARSPLGLTPARPAAAPPARRAPGRAGLRWLRGARGRPGALGAPAAEEQAGARRMQRRDPERDGEARPGRSLFIKDPGTPGQSRVSGETAASSSPGPQAGAAEPDRAVDAGAEQTRGALRPAPWLAGRRPLRALGKAGGLRVPEKAWVLTAQDAFSRKLEEQGSEATF
ncbi:collagen alpha-1(I) chain-like [Hyaena hyaena]|uniref:collagen alpha-1(I) chain-like n=1 Tax=Hyaena hyaena TaxID=95912 RepID=UPI001924CDC2|nr:collagen alpha-1(I) chain-like [Hyaena hyaena]